MSPTRILKVVLLALTLLLLWWVDPVVGRSAPPSTVFLWFAFLLFLIVVPLYLWPSCRFLPARRGVLWYLPLFFVLLSVSSRSWQAPEEPPAQWLEPPRRSALFATAVVRKEIRPGLVLADVQLTTIEHFTGRWVRLPGRRKRVRTPNHMQPVSLPSFPVAIQTRKTSMPQPGCSLKIRLTPKYFPKALQGAYLSSLRYHGASSYIRLKPWLIQETSCSPDTRSRWKAALVQALQQQKKHPFSQEKIGLSKEATGIALGMLTGKSGWMDRNTKAMASGLGILHLFAASGLHLGILYIVLYWPLSLVFGPKHGVSTTLPLGIAAIYVWLLGFPVSLVRAFLFVSLFALRSFVHRRIETVDHLLNTALLTALLFPHSMISLSALFSFSAVSGILFLFSPIDGLFTRKHRTKPPSLLKRMASHILAFVRKQGQISFAASLPVTPWIVLFFRSYAFLSPLANIVIVPLASLLLPLLFLSLVSDMLVQHTAIDRFIWLLTVQGFELLVFIMHGLNGQHFFVRFDDVWPYAAVSFMLLGATALLLLLHKRERLPDRAAVTGLLLLFSLTGPVGYLLLRFLS